MATPVLLICNDLIFSTKIFSTAKAVGVTVQGVRTLEALREKLAATPASMVIVDLNTTLLDPCAAVRAAKEQSAQAHVVAYLSHVQVELAAAAKEAGADTVLPRSAFSAKLPEILQQSPA